MIKQSIVHVALVVREYDEAIAFYTEKLGFETGFESIALEPPRATASIESWAPVLD